MSESKPSGIERKKFNNQPKLDNRQYTARLSSIQLNRSDLLFDFRVEVYDIKYFWCIILIFIF